MFRMPSFLLFEIMPLNCWVRVLCS